MAEVHCRNEEGAEQVLEVDEDMAQWYRDRLELGWTDELTTLGWTAYKVV